MTKEGGEARDKLEKIQLKQKSDDAHAEILMNRAHDIAEECKAFYKDAGLGAVKLPDPPIPVPEDWGKGVSADAAGGGGDAADGVAEAAAAELSLPRFRATAVHVGA